MATYVMFGRYSLDTERLDVRVPSAGVFRAAGRATEQTITINGAATYEAGELKSRESRPRSTVWAAPQCGRSRNWMQPSVALARCHTMGRQRSANLSTSQVWAVLRVWGTTSKQFVPPMALSCAPMPRQVLSGAISGR